MFLGGRVRAPADKPPSTGPVLTGAGVAQNLTAKTAGRWIVDAAGGAGSDTASLVDAVLNAKDGDEIALRPGIYPGTVAFAGKALKISGAAADAGLAVIVSDALDTVAVHGGSLALSDLTVRNLGAAHGSAVSARMGRVLLRNVRLELSPRAYGLNLDRSTAAASGLAISGGSYGIRLEDANLGLEDSSLTGVDWGLMFFARSQAAVAGTTITGGEMGANITKGSSLSMTGSRLTAMTGTGVVARDAGTTVRLRRVAFEGAGDGLMIYDNAVASVEDSTFSRLKGYGVAAHGAGTRAVVRRSTFTAAKIALHSADSAAMMAWDCAVRGSRDIGATAYDDAVLELDGSVVSDSRTWGVMALERGRVILRRSRIQGTTDAGVGIADHSSALLEDVAIGPGAGMGVGVGRGATLTAERVTIADHDLCGMKFPAKGGEADLKDVVVTRNECAIAFHDEGSRVRSVRGDFRGNRKMAFYYNDKVSAGVPLTGSDNKSR